MVTVGESYNNVIDGNEVWRNVKESISRTWSGGWARASAWTSPITAPSATRTSYDNWVKASAPCSPRAPSHRQQGLRQLQHRHHLDNAQDAAVQCNTVSHSYDTDFYRSGKPATGIVIANENASRMLPSSGAVVVTDNVLAGVGNLVYGRYGANTGFGDSTTSPNTIYSSPNSVRLRRRLRSPTPTPSGDPVASSEDVLPRSTRPSAGMSKSFPTSMWPLTRLPWITASLRNCRDRRTIVQVLHRRREGQGRKTTTSSTTSRRVLRSRWFGFGRREVRCG